MPRLPSAATGLGIAALGAWCAPAAAPVVPPSRLALPHPAPRSARGRADLRRRPAPFEGTPAVLAQLERAGVRATFYLVGEQVGAAPGTRGRDRRGRARDRDPRPPPRAPAPPHSGVAARRLRPCRGGDRRGDRSRRASPTARPTACSASRGCGSRASGGRRCSGRTGAATGSGGRRLRRSRRGRRAGSGRARSCCCTTATPTAPAGSWRQTVAALPAVLDAALATGEPFVTASQST